LHQQRRHTARVVLLASLVVFLERNDGITAERLLCPPLEGFDEVLVHVNLRLSIAVTFSRHLGCRSREYPHKSLPELPNSAICLRRKV